MMVSITSVRGRKPENMADMKSEDVTEREAFRLDIGEYLPSDIWPGTLNPPMRFEISAIDRETSLVPELPKKIIEMAMRRASERP